MKVFISHASEETQLAAGWKSLLSTISPGISGWFSSDRSTVGGIGVGKWREQIGIHLESADVVMTLITPESLDRPWLYFESAFALGMDAVSDGNRIVIPVVYNMDKAKVPSALLDLQCYRGDDLAQVSDLCKRLVFINLDLHDPGSHHGTVNTKFWTGPLEAYMELVDAHKRSTVGRRLFRSHFHNNETAKHLSGDWFAKWTQFDGGDKEKESIFEAHPMKIWSTGDRLRLIGEAKPGLTWYPMEGVVSSLGHVALSYWSEGENPICGCALLELFSANRMMKGVWHGYTAKTLDYDRLELISGRVVLGRDRERVEKYWAPEG